MAFRKKRKDPFREIQLCLQKRDYKGALDWFNTLLQKDPDNTQIRLRFADTLVLASNKREAVKQYRMVADELAEKGFMIRAIAINKKILQLDPSQTDVHEKLAAMNEERSSQAGARAALTEALKRPDAPAPEAPPASRQAPAEPQISLEESMAMEFGTPGELSPPEPAEAAADEPIPLSPPQEDALSAEPASREPDDSVSGGFELIEEGALAEAGSKEPPSFTEEPVELASAEETVGVEPGDRVDEDAIEILSLETDDGKTAAELASQGEEVTSSEPSEIVLDAHDDEAEAIETVVGPEEEPIIPDEEMEVIEFEVEPEPAPPPGGVEALVGALGEDIDSLIDSIIDDVGSSAGVAKPEAEEPPTHLPLFSDLTTAEFIDVALLLVRRVARVGENIVREGTPGDSMFIISTGEVRATVSRDGRQVPVATLRDGDFFGEMAVLSGEPRTATVTAVKNTELLELSRENLREICSRHPHVEAKIRLAYDERMARAEARGS